MCEALIEEKIIIISFAKNVVLASESYRIDGCEAAVEISPLV